MSHTAKQILKLIDPTGELGFHTVYNGYKDSHLFYIALYLIDAMYISEHNIWFVVNPEKLNVHVLEQFSANVQANNLGTITIVNIYEFIFIWSKGYPAWLAKQVLGE